MSYGARSGSGYGNQRHRSGSKGFGQKKRGKFEFIVNHDITGGYGEDPFEGLSRTIENDDTETFVVKRNGKEFMHVKEFTAERELGETNVEMLEQAKKMAEEIREQGVDVIVEKDPDMYEEMGDTPKEQRDAAGKRIVSYSVFKELTPEEESKWRRVED